MDSENVKQVVIGYNAIKDSCKAILKPIRIDLNDTETASKMSKVEKDTLEFIKIDCKAIQTIVGDMERDIDDLKESIYDDGEIDKARKMIADILFDIQPIPNKPQKTSIANHMASECIGVAKRTGKVLYK